MEENKRDEEYGSDIKIKLPISKKLENFWYHYKWHTIAAVFIIEMLSSFLQTLIFKISKRLCRDKQGRRLFKMAPLHHHFEKCGWNEWTVVIVFSLAEVLFCLLAWIAL